MHDRLDASNLPAFSAGCALLGAGGGGDPFAALAMALHAVEEHGPVQVVPAADVAPDRLVMCCGMLGAPAVATERLWSGEEGRELRAAVEELDGRRVDALMCLEIGGVNGLLPVTWAARLGLPLLDADGMGRSFASIGQQAMRLAGVPVSPVVLTDGRGDTVIVRAAGDASAARLAARAAASLGGAAAAALSAMTAGEAARAAITGSVSWALALGEGMRRSGAGREGVGGRAGARVVLSEGRVVDLERLVDDESVRGSATVRGTGAQRGRQLRLELQRHYLVAIEDGAVRACVPDVVCVVDSDTGRPVPVEQLGYGRRIAILAWAAPAVWRSAAGLELAGPRAFGYDVDHAPIAAEETDGGR